MTDREDGPRTPEGLSRRRFIGMVGAGAVSTALAAACTAPSGAAPTAQPSPVATATAVAKKRGGTLTVGLTGDIQGFDPNQLLRTNFSAIANLYDGLVRYGSKLDPQPGLAERWELSSDSLSMTLQLRKGVKFADGTEFDSAAVLKNFEKARKQDTGFNLFQPTQIVSDVEARDKSTVVVRFKASAPSVYDMLQTLYMINPAGMATLKNTAAGTGPFSFVSWNPGVEAIAKRNEAYWETGRPYADRVVWKIYRDTDGMIAALQSGLIDVATQVPYRDAARLKDQFAILEGPKGAVNFEIKMSAVRPPFDKKEVRQAMQYAVDRKAIVDSLLFGFGGATADHFPDFSPAYDPKWDQEIKFDPAKAKDLLAKGGFPNGFEAEMLQIAGIPDQAAITQAVQAQLSKLGINLKITVLDTGPYVDRVITKGDFQITIGASGRMNKYPTAIAGNSIYRTANNPGWGNQPPPKAYVDAVNDANSTLDPAKQKDAFRRMAQALFDESWAVQLCWNPSVFAVAKYVKDLSVNVDDMVLFHNVSVEK